MWPLDGSHATSSIQLLSLIHTCFFGTSFAIKLTFQTKKKFTHALLFKTLGSIRFMSPMLDKAALV